MDSHVIISGIKKGTSGVGRLVESIEEQVGSGHILYPGDSEVVREFNLITTRWWIELYKHLKYLLLKLFLIYLPLYKTNISILHPQTLGYKWVSKLVLRGHNVLFYVVDASFFCKQSYNHIEGEEHSCLRCLSGNYEESIARNCSVIYQKNNGDFPKFMRALDLGVKNKKIKFYTQCNSYNKLLAERFGSEIKVENIGLWLREFEVLGDSNQNIDSDGFDFVYHGSSHHAKGINWVISLSFYFPDKKFLIPCLVDNKVNIPKNCFVQPMTWEGGLETEVKKSKICILPSLWSAPIEGALVKTLILKKDIVLVDSKDRFSYDIELDFVLKANHDVKVAAEEIKIFLLKDKNYTTSYPFMKTDYNILK